MADQDLREWLAHTEEPKEREFLMRLLLGIAEDPSLRRFQPVVILGHPCWN